MNDTTHLNHSSSRFCEKTTEPGFVVYAQFRGVLNAPSRMWIIRDWARHAGQHLIGCPQCLFYPDGTGAEQQLCEIEWAIGGDPVFDREDAHLRWSNSRKVIVAYHTGEASTVGTTALALEAWGRAMGYRLTGTRCEVYHLDQEAPPGHRVTEIQLLIDVAPSPRPAESPGGGDGSRPEE